MADPKNSTTATETLSKINLVEKLFQGTLSNFGVKIDGAADS
jgi:hypothetical protein